MKRLIRFLAQISGVEATIRRDEQMQIAYRLADRSTWLTSKERTKASNALYLYSLFIRADKIPPADFFRTTLDEWGDENMQTKKNEDRLKQLVHYINI